MVVISEAGGIRVLHPDRIDLEQTLGCGQSFRWERQPDGFYLGSSSGKTCRVGMESGQLLFPGMERSEFEGFWRSYFDLDTDYTAICQILSRDETLKKAIAFAGGIRILRQERWEALCSFIISQNNNIKRISGIIARLCEQFGEMDENGRPGFPSASRLAGLSAEDLAGIRAGFRAKYLIDAAGKVQAGEVDLEAAASMPLCKAREELMKIKGVGVKVAECALLFGFHRVECLPVDTWIKKVLKVLYPGGLPDFVLPYAGIAQQYLFHFARCTDVLCEREDAQKALFEPA